MIAKYYPEREESPNNYAESQEYSRSGKLEEELMRSRKALAKARARIFDLERYIIDDLLRKGKTNG